MGATPFGSQAPRQSRISQWRKGHPYLFSLGWAFILFHKSLTVIFATWPSMHDPINNLLNAIDVEEADKLTEKWTDAKLKELNYVGLSVRTTERFSCSRPQLSHISIP